MSKFNIGNGNVVCKCWLSSHAAFVYGGLIEVKPLQRHAICTVEREPNTAYTNVITRNFGGFIPMSLFRKGGRYKKMK